MLFAGIDIGSITAKAALIENDALLETHVIFTGYNILHAGEKVFNELLDKVGVTKKTWQRSFLRGMAAIVSALQTRP